jgi:hypothetical protein
MDKMPRDKSGKDDIYRKKIALKHIIYSYMSDPFSLAVTRVTPFYSRILGRYLMRNGSQLVGKNELACGRNTWCEYQIMGGGASRMYWGKITKLHRANTCMYCQL